LIDEMIRSGVPARNPFFGETGTPDRVAYYYLWHFSAAAVAIMTGATGWEADAALTGFTAFASLLCMIGVAMHVGARPWAALAVVALATTTSLRITLGWLWPAGAELVGEESGFGGWLFQTSWAPQHVASATCVVIAAMLIPRLAEPRSRPATVLLGLVGAAAFQCSVWLGGIVLPLMAAAVGLSCLASIAPERRAPFAVSAAAAAVLAVLFAAPFVYGQAASAAMRGDAALVAVTPVAALGPAVPEALRRLLDPPAYWLVYLPVEFPAFYLAGLLGFCVLIADRKLDNAGRWSVRALSLLTAVSLVTAWLGASVIGDNNDLGWRAVLPPVMVLIGFAAALISRWPAPWSRPAGVLAALGVLLSLSGTVKIVGENLSGLHKPSERIFAATPELWDAVRRHTPAGERIANNPLLLHDMTPWPVNISWALLADRRSCYAGSELAIPFAPIPASQRTEIEAQFVRVFAGNPEPDDLTQLAERFHCDTIVVTPQDGAWQRDPFAASNLYRLVETKADRWRVYRRSAPR
jgi:MFS family permease